MAGKVKVLQIEKGIFRHTILLEATTDCSETYGSLMGPREFFMEKGARRIVKMWKGDVTFIEGEIIAFDMVCTSGLSNTAFQFNWR